MRVDGYAPIDDYAALGDGRTVALVARDGSVDWLCLPDMNCSSVFAAILDAEKGGRFALAPTVPFEVERRYLPGTNVLETTFRTAEGSARVTDALALPDGGLEPWRELVRRAEGLSGSVPFSWSVEPCFGYGQSTVRVGRRAGAVVADAGADAVGLVSWDAGEPSVRDGATVGRFETREGSRQTLALCAAHQEPLTVPSRAESEARLDETRTFWEGWSGSLRYEGPWREQVVRSALVLKLLVHAPTGAIVAAPTTSLPEEIGGERNWDYRFCWVRDSAFVLEALLDLGAAPEAESFFWWLLHASQITHPRLQVLYQLDGGRHTRERELPLAGYRGSRPVRVGNGAARQRQLDIYGDLLQTAWLYVRRGNALDRDTGRHLAEMADLVCEIWRQPDWGLWEVRSEPLHFTQSKMMCFVALDRARRLAEAGWLPRDGVPRWRAEGEAIRDFVESECYDSARGTYVRAAGSGDLDASVLLAPIMEYCESDDERILSTIDVVREELGRGGRFLLRYTGEDGLPGDEGCFLACSFWLVEALARAGNLDEAEETFEELLTCANDVGLMSEEYDPESGELLGNFPQALSHLGLVSAASAIAMARK